MCSYDCEALKYVYGEEKLRNYLLIVNGIYSVLNFQLPLSSSHSMFRTKVFHVINFTATVLLLLLLSFSIHTHLFGALLR